MLSIIMAMLEYTDVNNNNNNWNENNMNDRNSNDNNCANNNTDDCNHYCNSLHHKHMIILSNMVIMSSICILPATTRIKQY